MSISDTDTDTDTDTRQRPAAQHAARGGELLSMGDAAGAQACFQQALALDPDNVFALANLAWMGEQEGALEYAVALYLRALAHMPDDTHLLQNLGALLLRMRRMEEAEQILRRVLALEPERSSAWSNLGVLQASLQRETQAERCYRHAMELDPAYANARYNLAYLLLRQGRLAEGWQMLEARPQPSAFGDYFDFPRWQGESLAGKSLLICPEAGMGDMLLLCRYVPLLRDMGAASVSLLCHAPLKALLQTVPGIDEVLAIGEAVAQGGRDYWVALLSIPGLCGTVLETIPSNVPYVHADACAVAAWAARLPPAPLRVGLAWRGNRAFENDGERSLAALDALAPLGAVAGVQFVSLQKGAGEDDTSASLALVGGGAALGDMADTAALIANLDLVISVDTAVAHLAGALGTPCWLLLPHYRPDWRWLAGRSDSPWYCAMRLFHQPAPGGWAPLIAQVAEQLTRWRQKTLRAGSDS